MSPAMWVPSATAFLASASSTQSFPSVLDHRPSEPSSPSTEGRTKILHRRPPRPCRGRKAHPFKGRYEAGPRSSVTGCPPGNAGEGVVHPG